MTQERESKAREILWRMPADVFDQYIRPFIYDAEYGWPFESEDSETTERWLSVFDRYPLKILANIVWQRGRVPLNLPLFHPDTERRIRGILAAYSAGRNFALNSCKRLESLLAYMREHCNAPKPVIVLNERSQFRALDGNHRLTAAFTRGVNMRDIDAWVGSLRDNFDWHPKGR